MLAILAGCGTPPIPPYKKLGELVVATRMGPTSYYIDEAGQVAGFEHDLAERFGRYLGVPVRFAVYDDLPKILAAVRAGQVHLAAASFTAAKAQREKLRAGPSYQTVREQVIYNLDGFHPRSFGDLAGQRIGVLAGSVFIATLTAARHAYPELSWREMPTANSEVLLQQLAAGDLDGVVVDSDFFTTMQHIYPRLGVAFDASADKRLAWTLPPNADGMLQYQLDQFFQAITANGELDRLRARYYAHIQRIDAADVADIFEQMRTTLPRYRRWFQQAQEQSGVDWRLLAALAYQESRWDAQAVSPAGARGMMMLTGPTAELLKVKDRFEPKENILGGARYLGMLRDNLPPEVAGNDRSWLALAAYNIGYGHLLDARHLARLQQHPPDEWQHIKAVLPLLSRPRYYQQLKLGYARGGETVDFVDSVRNYYELLARFQPVYTPPLSIAGK